MLAAGYFSFFLCPQCLPLLPCASLWATLSVVPCAPRLAPHQRRWSFLCGTLRLPQCPLPRCCAINASMSVMWISCIGENLDPFLLCALSTLRSSSDSLCSLSSHFLYFTLTPRCEGGVKSLSSVFFVWSVDLPFPLFLLLSLSLSLSLLSGKRPRALGAPRSACA